MASSSDSDKKSKTDRASLPFEPKGSRKDKADLDAKVKQDSAKKSPKKPSSEKRSAKKGAKATGKSGRENSGGTKSGVSASAQAQVDEIRAMNRRKSEKFLAEKAEAENSGRRSGSAVKGRSADSGAIPEAVSRRMLRRMAILSGSPVLLGVGIFFLAYYLRSREIVEFAPIVVLLSTMGCFGLGVLGLTYGVLSASWDTEPGSLVGFSEFKLNFGRVMDARRASKT